MYASSDVSIFKVGRIGQAYDGRGQPTALARYGRGFQGAL